MESELQLLFLDQKPCFVDYLQDIDKFIVGTYELFPSIEEARSKFSSIFDEETLKDTLEKINHRAGKLILIHAGSGIKPKVLLEFECERGGGVFDAKVSFDKSKFEYLIHVAHSNGGLGVYNLCPRNGYKISLIELIKVIDSSMLTSVDLLNEQRSTKSESESAISDRKSAVESQQQLRIQSTRDSGRYVVGDAAGCITVIVYSRQIRRNVADGDSIWQVKSAATSSDKTIILVGADNCSWYVYGFDEKREELMILYQNSYKDFSAGVTSIALLETLSSIKEKSVFVLLGSYDETLKIYFLNFGCAETLKITVRLERTIAIENGGIWRVKELSADIGNKFCVAAMYAGSYVLSIDDLESGPAIQVQQESSPTNRPVKLVKLEGLNLPQKPLHYDIGISCDRTCCIADFNNSLCLFKTIE